jgi:uncharacterized protein (TIGR03067 family)
MRHFSYLIAGCFVALVCCRGLAGDADDAKKLQGTWEITDLIVYGKKVDFKEIKGTKFIFSQDKLTLQPPSDKLEVVVAGTYSFKIDPKKKPAEVDLTPLDGKFKGVTSPGIYELKGNTLRWCQSDDPKSKDRPKDFTSPEKSSLYVFTFKKIAK